MMIGRIRSRAPSAKGVEERTSLSLFQIHVIDEQNAVLDDDSAEKNKADEGGGVESRLGDDKGDKNTDQFHWHSHRIKKG
jgi:hypothetical protein